MTNPLDDPLTIAEQNFASRLLIGSSKLSQQPEVMLDSIEASSAQSVTVAIRRVDLGGAGENILDLLEDNYFILPNTAGCFTAKDAILTAKLAREALETDWVKLEVIGDRDTLYPDVEQLLRAADELVDSGFKVMPYCTMIRLPAEN